MRRSLFSLIGRTLAVLFTTGTALCGDCNCAKPSVKFTVIHSLVPSNGVKYTINDQEFESGTEYALERDKEYTLSIKVDSGVNVNCDTTVYVQFPHCTIEQKASGASTFEKGGLAKFFLDCDEGNPTAPFVLTPSSYKIKISAQKSDDAKGTPSPGSEVTPTTTPPSMGPPDVGTGGPVAQPAGLSLEIPLGAAKGSDGSYHSAGLIVNYGGVSTEFAAPSKFSFNSLPEVSTGTLPPVSQTTVIDGSSQITEKHFIGPDAVIRLRGWDGSAAISYTGATQSLLEVYDPSQYNGTTKAFSGTPHSYYRIGIATGNGMDDGISITQSNRGVVRTESIQAKLSTQSLRHQRGPVVTLSQMNPGGTSSEWSILTTVSTDGVVTSKTTESWLLGALGKSLLSSAVDTDDSPSGSKWTTFYAYYPDGRLKSVSHPNGSWEFYVYNGTTTTVYSPWLSSTLLTPDGELPSSGLVKVARSTATDRGESFNESFTNLSWSGSGVMISQSSTTTDPISGLVTSVRSRNSSEALSSWKLTYPASTAPEWKAGRAIMSWDGSGKATLYSYDRGDWTELGGFSSNPNGLYTVETTTTGVVASPDYSSDAGDFSVVPSRSSRTVTITGPLGVIRDEMWVCDASSSFGTEPAVVRTHEYEPARPFRHTGVKIGGQYVSETEYVSPLITRNWNESGVRTESEVDAWGELVRTTTSGDSQVPAVTTLYSRIGRTRTIQIDNLVVSKETDDVAGRIVSSEDATGAITRTTYENKGRTVTQIAPGGVTTITDSHFDGHTKSVTGSGVIPKYYSYYVDGEGEEDAGSGLITVTTTVGGEASARVSSETSNWDGSRAFSTSPDPSTPGNSVTLSYIYDTASDALVRVQSSAPNTADRVSVPPSYSTAAALGMYSLSGQETDGNGPVIASTDRLVETDTVFEKPSGSSIWHRKTTTNRFHTDGSSSAHSSTSWTALAPVATSHGTYGSGLRWTDFEAKGGRIITTNKDDHFGTATSRVTVEDSATSASPDSERIAMHGRETSSAEYGTGSPRTSSYDASGRVLRQVSSSGAISNHIYYPNGQLHEVRDHDNVATTYEYYPAGDLAAGKVSKTTRAGESTETIYNERGQVKETKGNGTYRVTWEYNTWGEAYQMRTYRTSTSAGDLTEWTYDPASGSLTKKTDAGLHEVNYTYYASGRLYQRKSNRTSTLLVTTTYTWDDFGASTGSSYSDGTTAVAIVPDRMGRPKTITDASGSRTLTYHPTTGTLDLVDYTSGLLGNRKIDYTWDTSLRSSGFSVTHTGMAGMDFSTTYGYDNEGRVLTVSGSGTTHTHSWLPGTSIPDGVSNSGLVRTLHHDRMQRVRGIENKSGATVLTRHGYILNAAGRRTKATRENGQAWTYGYDSKGQVTSGVKYFPDGTTAIPGHSFTYTYDEIGNRITANHGGNGMGVSYYGDASETTPGANALNQYVRVKTGGGRFILAEANSQVGVNGSNASPAGGLGFYWYQLSGTNTSAPLWSADVITHAGSPTVTGKTWTPKATIDPTYDLDGNLTWDGRWDYVWDAENRLVSMTTAAIAYASGVNVPRQKLDFIYDSEGRRVVKTVSTWNGSAYAFSSQIRFLYDGWNLISEYSATSATTTLLANQSLENVHTWGPDLSGSMQGSGGVGGLLSTEVKSSSTTCFPCYDGNGNISGWLKSDGTLLSRRDYSPFGQLIAHYKLGSSGAATLAKLNFGFSAKYADSESGLLYYGYRYYDSVTGRWVSRDPYKEKGGANLHAFLGNNGVNKIDKLGLFATEEEAVNAARDALGAKTFASRMKGVAQLKQYFEHIVNFEQNLGVYFSDAMVHSNGFLSHDLIAGVEYSTMVYCKRDATNPSDRYNYFPPSRGALPTRDQLLLGYIGVSPGPTEVGRANRMDSIAFLAHLHTHNLAYGGLLGGDKWLANQGRMRDAAKLVPTRPSFGLGPDDTISMSKSTAGPASEADKAMKSDPVWGTLKYYIVQEKSAGNLDLDLPGEYYLEEVK
jgi:RHS repeat-associated protein